MNYNPPYINSNIFNASYFTDLDDSLTLAAADLRYLKLTGGVVSGLTTFSNSLNVIGTLSINGSAIDLSLISGVTAGTPQSSKALSLNSSSQIDGNLQFATSRKILMNNSSSSGAYIDMGATASDRCISLFSDAASYYGFGAGGSQLRSFSKTNFAWYTGATQSVIGSTIMSLTSAGLLTTTSLALTGAISGVTTLGLSGVLTSSNATVSTLNSNGALVLSGGIGISNTTDAASSTNGGTFTTAGGAAIAKSLYVGNILNVSGVSATSNIKITTTANYNGVMDTASLVLKQASVTNGNKIGLDFMISTNDIDAVNTATCSIVHERLSAYVGDLVFLTKRTATATNPLIEALRISSTGTCSIANTSSGFQLDLGASGTGINTNALTTTSLTLGATAITATGIELNYLDLTTGAGTAEASKALVLDSSKNIATINNLGMSGILNMTAASTTIQMTVPNSIARSNFQWTGDTGVQWEYGMRGSSNTPSNALYWYSGGYRMILFNGGQLTVGGQQTPSTHTLQVNHATGSCIRMTYNLTSNQCDMSVSSGGILTIAPSGSVTAISGTTGSTSNTTGALTLSGGIGISLTTDAISSTNGGTFTTAGGAAIAKTLYVGGNIAGNNLITTSLTTSSTSNSTGALILSGGIGISLTTDSTSISNGGSFTTAGGMAIAKSVWCGGTIYTNRSTSGAALSAYCGTSNLTISGLLNSDYSIMTAGTTSLNIGTGSTIAMTIDGINQSIYGIGSLSATNLSATNLYGLIGTPAQTSITSLGTLSALTVSGLTTTGTLNLGGTLITASGTELNYCDLAGLAGTAEASKVLTLDASKNIATLNSLTSNYLVINTAINSGNCLASFGALNVGPIITAYGISSFKGTSSYPSVYFGSTNSILWMEGSNASVIEAEINISSGPGSTSTNGMRIGTCTANQFSLFTNATNRLIITSTGNVGIGSNASTNDKVFGILDGTVGSGIVDMRFGNALSTNNCFTMTYAPTSSGSGLNRLQFDPYGTSGALTILAKKYVGIGTTAPVCPLDVAGYDSGLGILAPYQYAGNNSGDGGYVASGTTTGVNINAIFRSNVIFDDKIYIRSDRRLKKDIAPLEVEQALRFVNEVDPVFYRKRDQPETSIQEIGYIAQDVMKAGFGNLITHTDNDNMRIEQEGDIENIQFNVEYTKVCAVLHAVIRDQQKRIDTLENQIEIILDELQLIKSYRL